MTEDEKKERWARRWKTLGLYLDDLLLALGGVLLVTAAALRFGAAAAFASGGVWLTLAAFVVARARWKG